VLNPFNPNRADQDMLDDRRLLAIGDLYVDNIQAFNDINHYYDSLSPEDQAKLSILMEYTFTDPENWKAAAETILTQEQKVQEYSDQAAELLRYADELAAGSGMTAEQYDQRAYRTSTMIDAL